MRQVGIDENESNGNLKGKGVGSRGRGTGKGTDTGELSVCLRMWIIGRGGMLSKHNRIQISRAK